MSLSVHYIVEEEIQIAGKTFTILSTVHHNAMSEIANNNLFHCGWDSTSAFFNFKTSSSEPVLSPLQYITVPREK